MALDFMAIVSNGTYPTPTPSDSGRAAYAVSSGMLGTLAEGTTGFKNIIIGIGKIGLQYASNFIGLWQ